MITDTDIRTQVQHSIEGIDEVGTISVGGIVRDIIDTYGLVDTETIEHDEYWAIVARNDGTQGADVITNTAKITAINDTSDGVHSWDDITVFDADGTEVEVIRVESSEEEGPYDDALRAAGYDLDQVTWIEGGI
jgi:hypothetical protein